MFLKIIIIVCAIGINLLLCDLLCDDGIILAFVLTTRYAVGKNIFSTNICDKSNEQYGLKSCVCFDQELMRYLVLETYPNYYLKYTKEEQNLLLNLISNRPDLTYDQGQP